MGKRIEMSKSEEYYQSLKEEVSELKKQFEDGQQEKEELKNDILELKIRRIVLEELLHKY